MNCIGASGTGTKGNWFDVYWTPISVTPSTTYYLVFTGNSTLAISGDELNPYALGQVYANSGFQSFLDYDYTFRTYYDDSTAPVPEPSTLLLLGSGLVGLVGCGRRRLKK